MSGLFGVQNVNRLGLLAHQKAIGVVGSNIANVNTPGFSRREVVLGEMRTGGVRVLGVNRIRNEFLDVKLRESNARLGARQVSATNLELIESALNETDDSGVSHSLREFFGVLQDLSLQPSGTTEREVLRSTANLLSGAIESTARQVRDTRRQIDLQIRQEVEHVNSVLGQLAEVNRELLSLDVNQENLALFDRRDALLEELSGAMPIHVVTDERGLASIFGAQGITLVEHTRAYTLAAQPDPSNDGFVEVGIETSSGAIIPFGDRLTEGSLGALLRVRDTEALETLNRIDRMTAELVRSFNAQHRLGTGLDGASGHNFFQGLSATGEAAFGNAGQAVAAAAAIADESLLTFHDYEVRFTSAGTYDVIDATSGATLSAGNAYASGSAITFAGLSLTISNNGGGPAAGDVFRVNSYEGTSERLALSAEVQASTDAIAAGQSAAPGDNRNALALIALRDASLLESGTQTLEQYYNNARVQLGIATHEQKSQLADEEIASLQITELASAARSVSVDEESVNLIQFQRAFQASSRMIAATDELLQTLINIL